MLAPLFSIVLIALQQSVQEPISFRDKVLPILSDRCFACHGPDAAARESSLRLDLQESAFADMGGYSAIVPGDPDGSELILRIMAEFESDLMPPSESNLALTTEEIETLRLWVEQGAKWEEHWAFVPPTNPDFAEHAFPEWVRGPIDEYVAEKIGEQGLQPNGDADTASLLRRVTFDLTGLPPTPEEYRAALAQGEHWDYEAEVDRLMASTHYGERMAWEWLDAARYADTDGFQADPTRQMWPWRDWLVDQLNANVSFDQMTREMLAGDLIAGATDEQRLGSGFNRNHMTNGEGGRIFEETRVENVFDRVETTATVWLGMTFQCARCHDHKYDPISQREYYQFADFFNQTSDTGRGSSGRSTPNMRYFDVEQQRRRQAIEVERADLVHQQSAPHAEWDAAQLLWQAEWAERLVGEAHLIRASNFTGPWWRTQKPYGGLPQELFARVDPPEKKVDLLDAELWREARELEEGKVLSLGSEIGTYFFYRELEAPTARSLQLSLGSDDAIKVWHNGVEVLANNVARGVQPDQESVTLQLLPGKNAILIKIVNTFRAAGVYFRRVEESVEGLSLSLLAVLARPSESWLEDEADRVRRAFRSQRPEWQRLEQSVARIDEELRAMDASAPVVLVMDELPREQWRDTRILNRGGYDQPVGDLLEAGVPDFLPPLVVEGDGQSRRANRLDLAEWLLDSDHPLTARVIVNREWQKFFGRGLVATPEDFGRQGSAPSHPELLDYLATQFVATGWDLKALHRKILLSSTYRQSVHFDADLDSDDPENIGLRRAPRHRLPAWMLRDQALALAGVLNLEQGGVGVRPYQPDGVWAEATFDTIRYIQDQGDAIYRRSLYVFWRRIVQPTFFFDTGKRQVCEVSEGRTNTPLHALVTLNETAYVEAARLFAERAWKEGEDVGERIGWAWFAATGRLPDAAEIETLVRRWKEVKLHYLAQPDAAEALLSVGSRLRDESLMASDLAALTVVCSLILNLDEVLCRA
ncbi:MAG: PSD1 and planctomycete cytochrome C domain-containing protein [Planctomycetes bacterium]|nr:PSD1 and planctomycete cytochrome C domain-containing protein [Planctomycetota bacterium]